MFTVTTAGKVTINFALNFNPKSVNTAHEDIIIDDVRLYDLSKASEDNPADLTGLIVNQDFNLYSGKDAGWTSTTGAQNSALATNQTGAFSWRFWENWNPSNYTGKMYQTLSNLPSGKYGLGLCAFVETLGDAGTQYIYAGDAKTNVTTTTPTAYTTSAVTVTDGALEIGFEQTAEKNKWVGIDNAKLYYYGPVTDFSAYATSLSDVVTKAEAIKDSPMNGTVKTTLTTAITTYSGKTSDSYSTSADWDAAIKAMQEAYDNAQTSVDNYATAKTYLDAASSFDDAGKKSYAADATVSALQTAYDNQTLEAVTSDQITAMTTALATAAKAQTTAGSDMTAAIVNPQLNGQDGWSATKPNGGNGPMRNTNVEFEYWNETAANGAFDYYQEITGLPAGKYTVSADMFNSLNGVTGTTFTATSGVYGSSAGTEVYKLVDVEGMTYTTYTTDAITVTNGTLRIGVKNTTTMTARWFGADNFKLTFVEAVKLDDYYTQINTLLTQAKAITGTMSNAAQTALSAAQTAGETAVGDTKETDIDKLNTVISDLTTAIANASKSVTSNAVVSTGSLPNNSIDGWTCTNSNDFVVNTWSKEVDASGFTTPFIQNWVGKGSNLGDAEIYYTLEGLPAGTYYISGNVRVLNEAGGATTGASFFVNDATMDISTATGAQTCTNGIYEGVYQSVTVEDNGSIKLGFKLASATFNWIAFKDVKISNDVKNISETVTIGTTGWATYVASTAVDYTAVDGLTAYTAKYDATAKTITLTPITAAVPANTAVVLKGTASTTYTLTPAASGTAVDNDLKGSNNTVTADGTQWCLTTQGSSVGFAPVQKNVVIPAKKAYLVISSNKAKFLPIDGTATGINAINAASDSNNAPRYNLAGQRVGKNYKGVVIVNGKKVIVK